MPKRTGNTATLLLCLFCIPFYAMPQAKQYSFRHYSDKNGLVTNHVQDIIQDGRGFIWLATPAGLQRYDGNKFVLLNQLPRQQDNIPPADIRKLFIDSKKDLWIISGQNRIGTLDQDDFSFKETAIRWKSKGSEYRIRYFINAKDGNLLMATTDGIYCYFVQSNEFRPYDKFVPVPKNWHINTTVFDPKNRNYIMGCDSGMAVFNPLTGHLNYHGNNPDNNIIIQKTDILQSVEAISIDSSNNFHAYSFRVGSPVLQSLQLTSGTLKTHHLSLNIPGAAMASVTGILQQKNGRLWIYGKSFIAEYNDTDQTFDVVKNSLTDGSGSWFNVISGFYEDNQNNLWLATDNGAFVFNPDCEATRNSIPMNVKITDFRTMNRSLKVDSLMHLTRILLPFDKNSITIEFNTLGYNNCRNTENYYQLEGLDNEWIRADERNQAIYSYLPSGHYRFNVKSRNEKGVYSATTTFLLKVEPPLWKTWWFYGILLLLGAVIFYLLDKARIGRMRSMQQVRSQIAGNLHDQINSTLNSINLLSEMARIKTEKDPERSKDYIDQINSKSRAMIIAMDDMLWTIDPENDSMEKTLMRMQEFAEALRNRYAADIRLSVDENIAGLELDMKARYDIYTIFRRSLKSIVHCSEGRLVSIRLEVINSCYSLKINSKGDYNDVDLLFTAEKMVDIKKRASSLQAKLEIKADSKEACVSLLVPAGRAFKFKKSGKW